MPYSVHVALTNESQRVTLVHDFICFICFNWSTAVQLTQQLLCREDNCEKWIIFLTIYYAIDAAGVVVAGSWRHLNTLGKIQDVLKSLATDRSSTSQLQAAVGCEA